MDTLNPGERVYVEDRTGSRIIDDRFYRPARVERNPKPGVYVVRFEPAGKTIRVLREQLLTFHEYIHAH